MQRVLSFALVLALALTPAIAEAAKPKAPAKKKLKCEVGPVVREYADEKWDVFGCDVKNVLLFRAAKGNPAAPTYFILEAGEPNRIQGEGEGDRDVSKETFEELKKLDADDVEEIQKDLAEKK